MGACGGSWLSICAQYSSDGHWASSSPLAVWRMTCVLPFCEVGDRRRSDFMVEPCDTRCGSYLFWAWLHWAQSQYTLQGGHFKRDQNVFFSKTGSNLTEIDRCLCVPLELTCVVAVTCSPLHQNHNQNPKPTRRTSLFSRRSDPLLN
jgi:hypothetical protein